jgi:hypothetical protein
MGRNGLFPRDPLRGGAGSSSQWITIDDFDKAYDVRYIKVTMDEYGTANDRVGSVWSEFPIREVRAYEDDRLFGEAALWDSAKETKVIPDTSTNISCKSRGSFPIEDYSL